MPTRGRGADSTITVSGPGGEVTITIRGSVLLDAAREAFAEANDLVRQQAFQEASRRKWPWPNPPSPRDVVRDGLLRSSITAEVEPGSDGMVWLHTVGVAYAAPVLLGYRQRTASGIRTYPGRNIYRDPVTRRMRGAFDAAYARLLRQKGGTA